MNSNVTGTGDGCIYTVYAGAGGVKTKHKQISWSPGSPWFK